MIAQIRRGPTPAEDHQHPVTETPAPVSGHSTPTRSEVAVDQRRARLYERLRRRFPLRIAAPR